VTRKLPRPSLVVSRRYVQEIESGEKLPTVLVLVRLRKALGCDWDEMFARL